MKRPRIKICGLTRADDVAAAVHLGADAVGFVLWPGSPRAVTAEEAARLTAAVPPFVTRVGVFVNAGPDDVARAVTLATFDVVQLHGDESPEAYTGLGARLIKSVTVEDDAAVTRALALPLEVTLLVDAVDPVRRGGTGRTPDWPRAAALAAQRPIVLAGGLEAANVGEAIRLVQPAGLDVSSGVEETPGRKSARKLEEFFAAVDAAAVGAT